MMEDTYQDDVRYLGSSLGAHGWLIHAALPSVRDRFDVVAVGIVEECRVVVLRAVWAQTRFAVVLAARAEPGER
jgi:hypothetical protein